MEASKDDFEKLLEIVLFYQKQIVRYGLPDKKKYRDFINLKTKFACEKHPNSKSYKNDIGKEMCISCSKDNK